MNQCEMNQSFDQQQTFSYTTVAPVTVRRQRMNYRTRNGPQRLLEHIVDSRWTLDTLHDHLNYLGDQLHNLHDIVTVEKIAGGSTSSVGIGSSHLTASSPGSQAQNLTAKEKEKFEYVNSLVTTLQPPLCSLNYTKPFMVEVANENPYATKPLAMDIRSFNESQSYSPAKSIWYLLKSKMYYRLLQRLYNTSLIFVDAYNCLDFVRGLQSTSTNTSSPIGQCASRSDVHRKMFPVLYNKVPHPSNNDRNRCPQLTSVSDIITNLQQTTPQTPKPTQKSCFDGGINTPPTGYSEPLSIAHITICHPETVCWFCSNGFALLCPTPSPTSLSMTVSDQSAPSEDRLANQTSTLRRRDAFFLDHEGVDNEYEAEETGPDDFSSNADSDANSDMYIPFDQPPLTYQRVELPLLYRDVPHRLSIPRHANNKRWDSLEDVQKRSLELVNPVTCYLLESVYQLVIRKYDSLARYAIGTTGNGGVEKVFECLGGLYTEIQRQCEMRIPARGLFD